MPAKAFLDSNILVYGFTETDIAKRDIARALLRERSTVISTQVLLETTNVLVRKVGARPSEVGRLLRPLMTKETIGQTLELVEESWRIAERYGFGVFDSAIIAAALTANCKVLYTEDLQHDQRFESLHVVNPFAS